MDPTSRYPYRTKKLIELVNRNLKRRSVSFVYRDDRNAKFNKYHFSLFVGCYDMKQDERYCHDLSLSEEQRKGSHSYIYSEKAVTFIVDEIAKDPQHIIQKLRDKMKRMGK